ncbi:hypothetical protein [Cellulosimicrobium sp. NPDC057127]|uniref:hypothetical protein n=1 Tax=Cellulosimicrobium sp. NPDC057127 TaxID=3346026 RepID=UPI00363FC790
MTRLVLVHGRDNQGLDPEELERTWLTALRAGLHAAGTPRRLSDDDASFVYYGDTLAALARGDVAPPVTVHAVPGATDLGATDPGVNGLGATDLGALPEDELAFLVDVAREVLRGAGVDDAGAHDARAVRPSGVGVDLGGLGGVANRLLSALDRYVPGLSGVALLLLVRDVWAYVHDPDVRRPIDDALTAAMPTDEPAVVVAHSLGSVVAYSVLREHDLRRPGGGADWDVPLLVTLGSPLAVRAVRDVLAARAPLRVPSSVHRWVAARDPRDALALHDLGPRELPLGPGSAVIEELVVDNRAPGHHAAALLLPDGVAAGYLAVPEVARVVGAALPAGAAT